MYYIDCRPYVLGKLKDSSKEEEKEKRTIQELKNKTCHMIGIQRQIAIPASKTPQFIPSKGILTLSMVLIASNVIS